ncbi:alpha/beta hydrolase [Candidatus Microgenomates bacterium]|jgi:dienelactone hydrolase|nr:MAG: alpha/beta hydrolase [Candidatus Microgenomates bacterium]
MNQFEKEKIISIPINSQSIEANLFIPYGAKGIVVFAHGSGSSRFSPRNNYVARVIQEKNIATLLIDLLTKEEDQYYENRFDIKLLTDRLINIVNWLSKDSELSGLSIGLFGASTGAAAALDAAALLKQDVKAVVSRGGRPDLSARLREVSAPVLFIVGGEDYLVAELNKDAFENVNSTKSLEIIPGATHLFEEPGALEQVAALAADWFSGHF